MVSTVTTSTVSTVSTTSVMQMSITFGVVMVVMLLVFLAIKEVVSARRGRRRSLIAKSLNIGIIPFAMVFALILAVNIVSIIG